MSEREVTDAELLAVHQRTLDLMARLRETPKVDANYCTCGSKKGHGFTKRDDGVWVRPCCMKRDREMWMKHGDRPLSPS